MHNPCKLDVYWEYIGACCMRIECMNIEYVCIGVCICVCVYIYIYIYVSMYLYVYIYIYVCMYTNVCT